MAVVLTTEDSYFSTTKLRRSHSQPKFGSRHTLIHSSASTSQLDNGYRQPIRIYTESITSSPASSPRTIHATTADDISWVSTPETGLTTSTDSDVADDAEDEDNINPDYHNQFFDTPDDYDPLPSPPTGTDTTASASAAETPAQGEHAADDTALGATPSRHVDYLSHEWKEEDVWSSWKYVVSNKNEFSNAARLENASWRSWMKAKNNLKTISAETLDWLKDCDVTWLYGPLQISENSMTQEQSDDDRGPALSKSNSFLAGTKPILKKRSMSEIMLQRYISSSSLIKEAASVVQAQQQEDGARRTSMRPRLQRAATDYITFPFSSRKLSRCNTGLMPSESSSGLITPGAERRHIHFNEQVEQCIAIEAKDGLDDDDGVDFDGPNYDSDSDDGGVMMKRSSSKRRPVLRRKTTPRVVDSKTIVKLPSTTLKYRKDTPEPPETAMKHSSPWRSPMISPSSSQETLRPSKASGNLFFVDAEDDDNFNDDNDDNNDNDNNHGIHRSSSSLAGRTLGGSSSDLRRSTSSHSLALPPGPPMRRTASGMLMPLEDDGEHGDTNDSLFGAVADTVNTARDIAHVIWNVGWRR